MALTSLGEWARPGPNGVTIRFVSTFLPTGFIIFMALLGLAFTVILVVVIAALVRTGQGARKLERQGVDPVTVMPEAAHSLGQLAANAAGSAEERLRELDRLRSEGLITAEEYAAQRAEIIKDV